MSRLPARDLDDLADTIRADALAAIAARPGERTAIYRRIAEAIIEARSHFLAADGKPDWTGRTHAYRRWVKDRYDGIALADAATVQAGVRYQVGNLIRGRLDADDLARLGLDDASPREKSLARREAAREAAGGPQDAEEAREALAAAEARCAAALARVEALRARLARDARLALGPGDAANFRRDVAALEEIAGLLRAG